MLTKADVTEGWSNSHMADTRHTALQMSQDSARHMITIKAMLNDIAAFGNKGTKAPFLNRTNFLSPASHIRMYTIRSTSISSLQEDSYLLLLIRSHFSYA